MGVHRVGHDKGMLAVLVLEEIVKSFFLEETRDEIEITFSVLNTIFVGRWTTLYVEPKIREPMGTKYLFGDRNRSLFMKDHAVFGLLQEPKPG